MKIGELLQKIKKTTDSKVFKNVIFFIGWLILFTGIFAGVDLFFQYLNNDRSIAVVNGTMIPRKDYYEATDKTYGSVIVNSLILQEVIAQEAAKNNISVTEEDIDNIVNQYITQLGGLENFEQSLAMYNTNLEQLREEIKYQQMTMLLYEKTLNPTEDQLKAYFDENKETFYGPETTATYEEKASEIREIFIAEDFEKNQAQWLLEIQNQYKVQNNLTAKPQYSLFGSVKNIFNNLKQESQAK